MLRKANILFRSGLYYEAIDIYDQLAKASPRNNWRKLDVILSNLKSGNFHEAYRQLDRIKHSTQIDTRIVAGYEEILRRRILLDPDYTPKVNTPADYRHSYISKKIKRNFSQLHIDRTVPSGFPFDLTLPPLIGNNNDFSFIVDAAHQRTFQGAQPSLRIRLVCCVYNKEEHNLFLKCLSKQTYPKRLLSIIIFSKANIEQISSNSIKYISSRPWKMHRNDQLVNFTDDVDIVFFVSGASKLCPTTLERVARYFAISSNLVIPLVSSTSKLLSNNRASQSTLTEKEQHSKWSKQRLPFRQVNSLNFAISAEKFRDIGGFESRFEGPELSTKEFCYRAYNYGCYFIPLLVEKVDISHLPNGKSSRDNQLYINRCPNPWDRKVDGVFEIPKVSIYIPAYNTAKYIVDAIESVLTQDFEDLEVCIAVDGSPDNTLEILERHYCNNPRVHWVDNPNGGIGFASNSAIALARGMYIGQLDSDDRLKPGAVKKLAKYLDKHLDIGCVYSSCERIDSDGNYIKDEYNFPVFCREKMMLTSITHHFRMFRRQSWERTHKFREDIVNAVDYDMFLKLSEVTKFYHFKEIFYQRRWHGENTSIVNESQQTRNTHLVQKDALVRQGLNLYWDIHVPDSEQPRKVTYNRVSAGRRVFFWPDYTHSNPYQRLLYSASVETVEFISGDINVAIKATLDANNPEDITFHLHWLNKIFEKADSSKAAVDAVSDFLEKIRKLKLLGARVVWTIHNTLSHDLPWRNEEILLSRKITKIADVLHIHSEVSLPEVEKYFSLPREKLAISSHGSYINFYPNFISRKTARSMLGLDPNDEVIVFVGQIRQYKGIDHLMEAFCRILKDRPNAKLLIGGKANYNVLADIKYSLSEFELSCIYLVDRFIDDAELQLFFKSADFSVFPYRHILTSGSMLLSLSFGTPVIIPEVGMTREVLTEKNAGLFYDGAKGSKALETAMRTMLALKDKGKLTVMRWNSACLAKELKWPDFNKVILKQIGF